MTDKPQKPAPMFGFDKVRIARLCDGCGKREAKYKRINYIVGQVRWLCAECAGESQN